VNEAVGLSVKSLRGPSVHRATLDQAGGSWGEPQPPNSPRRGPCFWDPI